MSDVTMGKISSEPNKNGEHSLKCPKCHSGFLSKITKDDETGNLNIITCPVCHFSEDPKHFIAAAHQAEVNNMATAFVTEELSNMLKKIK